MAETFRTTVVLGGKTATGFEVEVTVEVDDAPRIEWVEQAKRAETRSRRIAQAVAMLTEGKRVR